MSRRGDASSSVLLCDTESPRSRFARCSLARNGALCGGLATGQLAAGMDEQQKRRAAQRGKRDDIGTASPRTRCLTKLSSNPVAIASRDREHSPDGRAGCRVCLDARAPASRRGRCDRDLAVAPAKEGQEVAVAVKRGELPGTEVRRVHARERDVMEHPADRSSANRASTSETSIRQLAVPARNNSAPEQIGCRSRPSRERQSSSVAPEMQHGVVAHQDRKVAGLVQCVEAEAVAVVRHRISDAADGKRGNGSVEASDGPPIKMRHASKNADRACAATASQAVRRLAWAGRAVDRRLLLPPGRTRLPACSRPRRLSGEPYDAET